MKGRKSDKKERMKDICNGEKKTIVRSIRNPV